MAPALVAVAGGGGRGDYPGKLTGVVLLICIVAAMGGLSFGYDIGISGGVTSMPPFLKKFFPAVYRREQSATNTNQYCTFNDEALTLFTSSLYLAALVASFVASYVTRKLGRRLSMFLGGLIFFIGAVLNAGATGIWMLILGRILLGIGVGFSVQSVPVYVSEMAPYKHRGKLNVVFQLSITIGILVANVVNYGTSKIGNNGWRVSLGGACVPAAFIFVSAFFLPNSPNSMLEKGEFEKARAMLQKIRGVSEKEVEAEFQDLVAASEASKKVQHPWRNLIQRQCRPQLTMSILIPFFQQLTGINVVMFYAPVLFRSIGFKNDASLMSAAITGGVNVAATFLSIATVDKLGRRFWFLQGGGQMIIFQSLIAGLIGWKFGVSGQVGNLPSWYAVLVVTFICIYVAAFAWSWGPLGWLVPSEIFPLEIRSAAQSINASVNMLFTFVIAELFLKMLCSMKFGLFIFFAVLVVFMTVFVYYFLPETKGIPIEEMSKVWRDHWFWRRFVPQEDDPKAPRLEMV